MKVKFKESFSSISWCKGLIKFTRITECAEKEKTKKYPYLEWHEDIQAGQCLEIPDDLARMLIRRGIATEYHLPELSTEGCLVITVTKPSTKPAEETFGIG